MNNNTTFYRQKQQLLSLFQKAINLAKERQELATLTRLKNAAQNLINGKLMAVVAGEFKQGKSSLLDAILEEPALFPVDLDIATNLVSTIAYGKKEEITVLCGDFDRPENIIIERSQIADYVTEKGNKDNHKQARILSIESPNQKLKEGLILVDTPGLGSLNIEHTQATNTFIVNADVVLFVSDATAPLSTKELDFIRNIHKNCPHIIFIVTKIDAVKNYQEIVESNRQKLAKTLQLAQEIIPIIPVSSRTKLAYLKSQDPEDLEDSNFETLEKQLWQLLNQQRGKILLSRALNELADNLASMQLPLQTEFQSYQKDNQEKLDELETQLQKAQNRYKSLSDHNSQWLTQLNYGIQDIRKKVLAGNFERGARQIRLRMQKYLDDPRLLAEPQQIANLIVTDVNNFAIGLGKEIVADAEILQSKIEFSSQLNLSTFEIGDLSINSPSPDLSQVGQGEQLNWWKKTVVIGRKAASHSGSVTLIGGTIGWIFGGVFGFSVGQKFSDFARNGRLIGAAVVGVLSIPASWKKSVKEINQLELNNLKKEVAEIIKPFTEDSLSYCRDNLERGLIGLERYLQTELKEKIRLGKETWEKSLQSLQQARKLSKDKISQRLFEIKAPLQQLTQLQQATETLAQKILIPNLITVSDRSFPQSSIAKIKQTDLTSFASSYALGSTNSNEDETRQTRNEQKSVNVITMSTASNDFGDWANG
ncbi:GTP-binding protein HSR1-related protein [Stanieria cyanosphaera PCC 7437]|uniref:GTP-binding protein HSR1-related protein n=1 Tax=Stanieria cyanosphaera (strain ATCC 29371 / PCC 7437) TaxID=111780 RepID=K9XZC7_STAC7|nr:dynamin family protein [Stanieria cyanosphaera]AFZ37950.1 GTP-binding protein HSR1-related protein [Stanieria cyanosphaera PCC 7437]